MISCLAHQITLSRSGTTAVLICTRGLVALVCEFRSHGAAVSNVKCSRDIMIAPVLADVALTSARRWLQRRSHRLLVASLLQRQPTPPPGNAPVSPDTVRAGVPGMPDLAVYASDSLSSSHPARDWFVAIWWRSGGCSPRVAALCGSR